MDAFSTLLTILDSAAIGHLTTEQPHQPKAISTEGSYLSSAAFNHLTSRWQEILSHDSSLTQHRSAP